MKVPRKALSFRDNISSFIPELENSEPHLVQKVTTIQDVIYIEMTFVRFDSHNLDIMTDFSGHST